MFERFTDRARLVVVQAQNEARGLNHAYIGTEHILLGLLHEEAGGVALQALNNCDIMLDDARVQVEKFVGKGEQVPTGHIPFTPRGKKVLELALREALQLGHSYISTEHILLGLIREGEGVAVETICALGGDLNKLRQAIIELLVKDGCSTAQASSGAAARPSRTEAEIRAEISLHEVALARLNIELAELTD